MNLGDDLLGHEPDGDGGGWAEEGRRVIASRTDRPAINAELRRSGNLCYFAQRLARASNHSGWERCIEGIATALHCSLPWTTAKIFAPVTVRLSADLDERDGSLLHGTSPKHTSSSHETTIVYGRAQTGLPLGVRKYRAWYSHKTTTFMKMVAGLEQNRAIRGNLVLKVNSLLQRRLVDEAQVARLLGVSVATLRRQLANEGVSFRDIAGEARLRLMMTLLRGDQSLDHIADDLGFADRRSLWRGWVSRRHPGSAFARLRIMLEMIAFRVSLGWRSSGWST